MADVSVTRIKLHHKARQRFSSRTDAALATRLRDGQPSQVVSATGWSAFRSSGMDAVHAAPMRLHRLALEQAPVDDDTASIDTANRPGRTT